MAKRPAATKWLFRFSFVCSSFGGIVILKDYLGGKKYEGDEQALGLTAIVTGANCGIGEQVTLELAKRKGRVIMACKDLNRCNVTRRKITEETFNKNVVCRKCDLASIKSIKEFCDQICAEEKRVDLLINNAAVMRLPKHKSTLDGFEYHLGVNHLGHFYLTQRLLDKLNDSVTIPRIINVNCQGHTKGSIDFKDLNCVENYDGGIAYNQSKLAQMLFHMELAERLKDSRITVLSVNPGNVRSKLGRHMQMNKSYISGSVLGPIWWLLFRTPKQGAQTVLYLALSQQVTRDQHGGYFKDQEALKMAPNVTAEDAKRLWAISEKWTQLREKQVSSS